MCRIDASELHHEYELRQGKPERGNDVERKPFITGPEGSATIPAGSELCIGCGNAVRESAVDGSGVKVSKTHRKAGDCLGGRSLSSHAKQDAQDALAIQREYVSPAVTIEVSGIEAGSAAAQTKQVVGSDRPSLLDRF